ncbi:hypothetical protein Taro_027008 [Colocasia esculenta]|uniref:Uncharacterized protein n=1 Tax=Colocasia esculenta TaxID=4460 RepID=A0A843VMD5_COLES|nr:hypothetical protein [Colocasia esculenta]
MRWCARGGERERPVSAATATATMCTGRSCIFLEILIAILVLSLGVFLRHGCCSIEFCICLLLTFLGYVLGIIYAVSVIVAMDPEMYRYWEGYWQPIRVNFAIVGRFLHLSSVLNVSCSLRAW